VTTRADLDWRQAGDDHLGGGDLARPPW
jgi:hypothetical protein